MNANTKLAAMAALLCTIGAAAQTTPKDYHLDINATSVGAQTKRAESIFFPSAEQALSMPFEQSPNYLSLNGEWDFSLGSYNGTIRVPGNWEFQGFDTPIYINTRYEWAPVNPQPPAIPQDNPLGVYSRSFSVPQEWAGREVYLNVCGAKSGCYVFVNGSFAGYFEDSKDLARFDITPLLAREGQNRLELRMHRWSTGSYLECQDFWRVSGIERDVYLSSEKAKADYDWRIVSTLDESCTNGIFSVSGTPAQWTLLDADLKTVVAKGSADGGKVIIPGVRRWSAETPELYRLLVEAGGEYTVFDVGFRRLEVKGNVFYVNGQSIKFKGVNFHEHNQFTGHYLTRADIRANLKRMREANINAIRTCHYPQQRAFYELCDSLGFYVYDEANVESHGMGYGPESLAKHPEWYPKHIDRILNMYGRTANYPCVTILSLGNEAGNGVNFIKAYNALKALEKEGQNRPVVYEQAHGGYNTDFLNPMYPDTRWLHEQGELPSEKPVVMCEYAHAMGNSTGSFDWMWQQMYSYKNLQGGFIWDWMDQGVAEVADNGSPYWTYGGDYGAYPTWETDWNFNCNGVVNPDLEFHPGAVEIKFWQQDVWVVEKDAVKGLFELQNRFYFKDLSDYELFWTVAENGIPGKLSGRVESLCAGPQGSEPLEVDLSPLQMKKGAAYHINFSVRTKQESPLLEKGFEVATAQFCLQEAGADVPQAAELFAVKDKGARLVAGGLLNRLVVDKATGFVVSFRSRGRQMIDSGFGIRPNLWRPVNDNEWGYKYPAKGGTAFMPDSLKCTGTMVLDNCIVTQFALANGCSYDILYALDKKGNLFVNARFDGAPLTEVAVPRVGVRMRVKGAPKTVRYFGRGPAENYSDRYSAYPIGLYEASVAGGYFPYVRPQETGHHTGCRFLEAGSMAVWGKNFEFNALDIAQEDLDSVGPDGKEVYKHVSDISHGAFTEVCIDGFSTGVGGYNSWGKMPEPDRTVWSSGHYEFEVVIGKK